MSKTFEVLALVTRKEYIVVKANDGTEAMERVDTNEENIFDKSTIFGNYLNKSMDFFTNKKVKYLVFAGGKRNGDDSEDIQYIKKVFKGKDFIISDSNDPMVDFTTIMSCDHNITCHQSTFGWWAAYLNENPNKIVTSPEHYFFLYSRERNDQRIQNGHFPKDWNIIK